jgi:hypothetical protein
MEIIDPCGTNPNIQNEVLIRYNGHIYASFSDSVSGMNTRLSILRDGSYMTTDGEMCRFTVKGGEVY